MIEERVPYQEQTNTQISECTYQRRANLLLGIK
jgi:hypothetical protein